MARRSRGVVKGKGRIFEGDSSGEYIGDVSSFGWDSVGRLVVYEDFPAWLISLDLIHGYTFTRPRLCDYVNVI